jgi:hypothetical protein
MRTCARAGFPDDHAWSNAGCGGIHSSERADERFPWVTIDLGATHAVHTVQIWNRERCAFYAPWLCQSRLWRFAIYVGDTPPPRPFPEQGAYPFNGPPCFEQTEGGPLGKYKNFGCIATGRYVTLQQTGSLDVKFPGVMNVCQLRVFGDAVPPPPAPAPPPTPARRLLKAKRARALRRGWRGARLALLAATPLCCAAVLLRRAPAVRAALRKKGAALWRRLAGGGVSFPHMAEA